MSVWVVAPKNSHLQYEVTEIMDALDERDIPNQPVNPDDIQIAVGENLYVQGIVIDRPWVVVTRMGSTMNRTDAALLRNLHWSIPKINTLESIEMARDKERAYHVLRCHGIRTPDTLILHYPIDYDLIESYLGWPCIVKVPVGSRGNGVQLCRDRYDLARFTQFLDAIGHREPLLVQHYHGDRPGEDIRVTVIDGKAISAVHRCAPRGEIRSNVYRPVWASRDRLIAQTDGIFGPTSLDEVGRIAEAATTALGLDMAGVDLLFDPDGFVVCEVNPNPYYEGADRVCGTKTASHIADLVQRRLVDFGKIPG